MIMDFQKEMEEEEKRIISQEQLLGKAAMQPFANTNSGSRKILFETQLEHSLALMHPEVPIVQTGYEIRFGDHSSSIIKAEDDLEIVDKIFKFQDKPNHHYFLITRNLSTGEYDYIERKTYYHSTEAYGYLYDNTTLDNLDIGYEVKKGEILRKSYAFDEYMNRCDGVNLLTAYVCTDKSMEDGIIISESAAEKLASPLIREVKVQINDNDFLLNLFGDIDHYKSFPDIGESIDGGILCAVRREKIEECLYMQSIDRLNQILMSDTKYTVEGQVVDITVHCNNPDTLNDKYSNIQVDYYYKEHKRFNRELIGSIENIMRRKDGMLSYDLKKLYQIAKDEEDGKQFIVDKSYSGTMIVFHVLQESKAAIGDKVTNRYGGKGVISTILPDELMPKLDNGKSIEICFNSSTYFNRENPGQVMEMSLNYISARILDYIESNNMSRIESINMIYDYLKLVSPKEADFFLNMIMDPNNTSTDVDDYIDDMISSGYIIISNLPMSESMTLDRLNEIYKEFPFIKPYYVMTKMKDSNGNYRDVPARRTIVAGLIYIYRLKQYAEEKFSVTSLSSTNIKNENTRNKANKNYKALHTSTPIRFGEMESGDMMHLGAENVVYTLMIHSVSPQARRLVESALTGDPYSVNIILNSDSKNRSAEILNAYLKTMGLRLVFKKIKKKKTKLMTRPLMTRVDKNKLLMQRVPVKESYTVFGRPYEEWYLEQMEKRESLHKLMYPKLMVRVTEEEKLKEQEIIDVEYKEEEAEEDGN